MRSNLQTSDMHDDRLHLTFTTPLDDLVHELLPSHYHLVTAESDEYEMLQRLTPTTIGLVTRGLAPFDGRLIHAAPNLLATSRTGAEAGV